MNLKITFQNKSLAFWIQLVKIRADRKEADGCPARGILEN